MMRIVVVGAGNAALCAALSAREAGADVVVLEKAPREERGGNSHFTDGAIRTAYDDLDALRTVMPWMDDHEAESLDMGSYPVDAFLSDLERMSGGRADPDLARVLAGRSLDTLRWMTTHGVSFAPIYDNQAFESGGKHRFWGGLVLRAQGQGIGLIGALFSRCEELGVAVRYETGATGLVMEDASVTGVRIAGPDGEGLLEADAVVLACGGFEANRDLRDEFLGVDWSRAIVRGTRHNTGDGLRMALDLNAEPWGDWEGCHAVAMDLGAPESGDFEKPGDVFKKHSYPLGIIVNRDGERFVDEGADFRNYTYARYGREVLRQPDGVAFQIFDGRVADQLRAEYGREDTTRHEADSVAELAAQLEIDVDAFVATVAEYNAAVQPGDYEPHALDGKRTVGIEPPKSNWALPLDTPPFLGFPVRCGITFTFGGIHVDTGARVLDPTGRAISGLYAAGEMVGGLFYDNYPGGAGLISGAVFGRIAGASAAGDPRGSDAERAGEGRSPE